MVDRNYVGFLRLLFFIILTTVLLNSNATTVSDYPLDKVHIDPTDKKSLQRGAKLYINYCAGCHSLGYLRYNGVAKDLDLVKKDNTINKELVEENLIFPDAKLADYIKTSMQSSDAKNWFGVKPPDLSLITRIRGVDWVYSYLRDFYQDENRPWGVNNAVFIDVAMPNVLAHLQGMQKPVYVKKTFQEGDIKNVKILNHLVLTKNGEMSVAQFDQAVKDIVNFLAYTADPVKLTRVHIGLWVLLFLALCSILLYFLKKEFWKDVK